MNVGKGMMRGSRLGARSGIGRNKLVGVGPSLGLDIRVGVAIGPRVGVLWCVSVFLAVVLFVFFLVRRAVPQRCDVVWVTTRPMRRRR